VADPCPAFLAAGEQAMPGKFRVQFLRCRHNPLISIYLLRSSRMARGLHFKTRILVSEEVPVPRVALEPNVIHAQAPSQRPPSRFSGGAEAAAAPFSQLLDSAAPPPDTVPSDRDAADRFRSDAPARDDRASEPQRHEAPKSAKANPPKDDKAASADKDKVAATKDAKDAAAAPDAKAVKADATDTGKKGDDLQSATATDPADAMAAEAGTTPTVMVPVLTPATLATTVNPVPADETGIAAAEPSAAPATALLAGVAKIAAPETLQEPDASAGQAAPDPKAAKAASTDAMATDQTRVRAEENAKVLETGGKNEGRPHAEAAEASTSTRSPRSELRSDVPTVTADAGATHRPGGEAAANPNAPTAPSAATASPAVTTAQTAAPAAAVPIAGLAVEIAAHAQIGKNRFEIRLDPPELGRINVRLDVDHDGHVTSHLLVDRAETLDLLRRDAPNLERAFQQAGLKTSDNGLQFSLRDQAFAGRDNGGQASGMARVIVPDDQLEPIDTMQRSYGRLAEIRGGVDIRV
jgi:flagellar hook-length control protein FliK